ncbi:sensor histidine kinase [Salibacterium salarium]|nr:sensor histidine kinase [Salibacterium salarium]
MKNIFYLLIVCLASLFISACRLLDTEKPPEAEQGVLDLTEEWQQEDQTFTLDGEWEFYWEQLLEPSLIENGDALSSDYIKTPENWYKERFSNHGYATYRLQITLPEEREDDIMGLYIPDVNTAYTLWGNGKELASNGTVGINRSEMHPKHHPEITYFQANEDVLNVLVQVSDYYQRKSGWSESFHLGSSEAIQNMRDKNVAVEVFLVISLLVMGLYHIGIFILRPKDRSTLFFGGVCLAVAMRTLLLGEVLLVHFIPAINWELSLKLEYWGSCFGIIFFLLFIHAQFQEHMNHRIKNMFLMFFTGFAFFILVTPARVFTEMMLLLQLFAGFALLYLVIVLVGAFRNKRKGARLHMIAMTILLAFVINDILYYNHIVDTGETVSLGLFLYLFAQSFILSNVFARALTQSEQLSNRLEKVNQTLEVKVEERTKKLAETNEDLEQANERLEKMHRSRQELMSNISHELGTPLTSIQGYIKGMLDGVVDRNDPKYLQLVYDKTLFLRQIIQDLRELARLESNRMKFEFVDTDIHTFVQRLAETYRHEIESKNIEFRFENNLPPEGDKMVELDPIRIEQVVTNLLFNARKFTQAGSGITIELNETREDNASVVQIAVHDTGQGISPGELPKVFDRFYKGKSNNVKAEDGAGLGLAISAEIVYAHGGKMGTDSEEGKGSTFYFTLPVRDSKRNTRIT